LVKVLLVGSSGGHLAQLLCLRSWWSAEDRLWVTFDTADAVSRLEGEPTRWAYHPTTRNLPNLVRNTVQAVGVLRSYRPDVVITTGAGVAVPYFWLARLFRARTVYLEVFDRIDSRTLTARLCRPVTDLFLVQWDEQLALYPGAVLLGPVW
jgi:UDP-N-acetylglucosamine:LPS N-acetylglucosamine transferase